MCDFSSVYNKDCAGSQILPYFYINQLACNCFIDADRRHETPGLETKDFITLGKSSSQSFICLCQFPMSPPNPIAVTQRAHYRCLHISWLHYTRGTLSLGNPPLLELVETSLFVFSVEMLAHLSVQTQP